MDTYPAIDLGALLFLALLGAFLYLWNRWLGKPPTPAIDYSDLHDLTLTQQSPRTFFAHFPGLLRNVALGCFALALLDPRLMSKPSNNALDQRQIAPTEGLAIYLLLDQSGSMEEQVLVKAPNGASQYMTKIELLKHLTKAFVENRPNDLLGLVFFARIPQIMAPLTLDHSYILQKLETFKVIGDKTYDGTQIGYAIFKIANIIAETRHYALELKSSGQAPYNIKGAFILIVTDGFQEDNPLDQGNRLRTMGLQEAAEYAKSQGVKVYIANIDPTMKTPEFEPQRNLLTRITDLTGGKVFFVDNPGDLASIYDAIDTLEKTNIPRSEAVAQATQPIRKFSFYPFLIAIGLIALCVGILLETTLLRSVP